MAVHSTIGGKNVLAESAVPSEGGLTSVPRRAAADILVSQVSSTRARTTKRTRTCHSQKLEEALQDCLEEAAIVINALIASV